MAPVQAKSDIIISIRPQHVANIVSRVKDHEYRKYLIPLHVKRLWIYETRPASAIKYVADISTGKRPGEIVDERGLLNADFNRGALDHDATYAYEIKRLEELETPITLEDLKARKWLNGPPQKYCYVNEAMAKAVEDIKTVEVFGFPSEPPAPSNAKDEKEKNAETVICEISGSKCEELLPTENYSVKSENGRSMGSRGGVHKRGYKRQRTRAR